MVNRKPIRTRGKLQLSRWFQNLKTGDRVSVKAERSVPASFPKRLQGRTGVVEERCGKVYMVKIKDQEKEKRYLIEAIHLKKIKTN